MTPQEQYDKLIKLASQHYIIRSVLDRLQWDYEVMMPPGELHYHIRQIGVLEEDAHEHLTSDEMGSLLAALENAHLAPEQEANVREIAYDYWRAKRVPGELVKRITEASTLSDEARVRAVAANDFSLWAPHLKQMIALLRERAQYIDPGKEAYAVLFEEYEAGVSLEEMRTLLDEIKAAIVPLLQKIAQQEQPENSFLFKPLDSGAQLKFSSRVASIIGYDFNRGRLDLSKHPMTFGPAGRITTRASPDWSSMIFSTIHESGHAFYDQGLPQEHFGTPLGEFRSLGVHESQSRLWENCIARSDAFWTLLYPLVREAYGLDVTKAQLVRAVNCATPGLIRVEADELTYTLHIIARFELEQQLIAGTLAVEDLPRAWAAKYQELLGLTPPDDRTGVMQDVHWCFSFGYFPTYALGNIIAAQLFAAIRRDIPDLDARISHGDFAPIHQWLTAKIHAHGRRYPTKELIRRATGKEISADDYIRYITEKFSALYSL